MSTLNDAWLAEHPGEHPKRCSAQQKKMLMIKRHGEGPPGRQCKDCKHLGYTEHNKRYYKCELRGVTSSATTDHGYRWPACGKFEEDQT